MTERDLRSTADLQEWHDYLDGLDLAEPGGSLTCTECSRTITAGGLVQLVLWYGDEENMTGGISGFFCALCRFTVLPLEALDTRRDTIAATGTLDDEGSLRNVSVDALHPPTDTGKVRRELHVED